MSDPIELDADPTPMPPEGMFYDDMHAGLRFPEPAGVTIDDGMASLYTAISGDGLALTLDRDLCRRVTGSSSLLANPALVMHVSIGASTVATRNVIGNLFYRNVVLRQQVFLGETLRTVTGVRAMADSRPKPGSKPRGKALLTISTTSGGDTVVDYERCPLLPCRGDDAPGHADEIGAPAGDLDLSSFTAVAPAWDLAPMGPSAYWVVGETRHDLQRDVVDMATALVRITHNQAAVHRDVDVSAYDVRLVYGGHTVALAQASLNRVLPGLVTVLGWQACSHTAPVFEDDILSCRHTLVEQIETERGTIRAIHVEVDAHRPGEEPVTVLDWTPVVLTT
ncbi:MAG: acyl dehydratase [Actinomycetota bacterium]